VKRQQTEVMDCDASGAGGHPSALSWSTEVSSRDVVRFVSICRVGWERPVFCRFSGRGWRPL
jgi:hypothetical protein